MRNALQVGWQRLCCHVSALHDTLFGICFNQTPTPATGEGRALLCSRTALLVAEVLAALLSAFEVRSHWPPLPSRAHGAIA
jgi:hypothetical protein